MIVHASQQMKVEIDKHTQLEIARAVIRERLGLPQNYGVTAFINREGNLVLSETMSAGCHSYDDDRVVRVATDLDKAGFLVLEALK